METRRLRHTIAWLVAALASTIACPVRAETEHDVQIWANVTVTGLIGPRIAYFVEVQPRTIDGVQRLNQLIFRPAIGWKFSDAVTAYGGYMHVLLPNPVGHDANEDRLFAQLSWNLADIAGGKLSSRSRIERRRVSTGHDTGWRAREMLRYVHPLTTPDRPRALVSLELFGSLNDTDWGAHAGFDQARTFVGLEVPIKGGKSTFEIGYLNQTVNAAGGVVRVNHIASLALFIRP